jgi:hypothetical protein
MLAGWTLYVLIKLSPAAWLACLVLVIWHVLPLSTNPDTGTIVFTAALAITGSVCYALRRFRSDTAGLLLEALIATPKPRDPDGPGLCLVTEATRPSTPGRRDQVL